MRHHVRMDAYSEDLRKKIVEAVERGTPKAEAARLFGVGISSVKRHPAPGAAGRRGPGRQRAGAGPRGAWAARGRRGAERMGERRGRRAGGGGGGGGRE